MSKRECTKIHPILKMEMRSGGEERSPCTLVGGLLNETVFPLEILKMINGLVSHCAQQSALSPEIYNN